MKNKDRFESHIALFYLALGLPTPAHFEIAADCRLSNGFGLMIDTVRAEPVLIEKHGRGVVVVVAVEEYERLSVQAGRTDKGKTGAKGASKDGR